MKGNNMHSLDTEKTESQVRERDTLSHIMVHFVRDSSGSPIGFIAIHRGTKKHPAFGATRVYDYEELKDARDDALRLAYLMSYKNALTGSLYGGGKGVIIMSKEDQSNPKRREELFLSYANEVNKLGGAFVTGADVGVSMDDVRLLRNHSPYIVGLSRNPVLHTAQGVLAALRAALKVKFDNTNLHLYSYSILGVGKVGFAILEILSQAGAKVSVADINLSVIERVRREYPNVEILSPENLMYHSVDVFIPCAMGGVLNAQNISTLPVKIIVGSANNQLSSTYIGDKLHMQGILYVPDYVANGGGLISVINEYEQNSDEELVRQVNDIEDIVLSILQKSKEKNIAPHRIADDIAEERINTLFLPRHH